MLKQRIKGSYYEIKKKFKDNDPEQKGNVSRYGNRFRRERKLTISIAKI